MSPESISHSSPPLGQEWADPNLEQIHRLVAESARIGWRDAIEAFEAEHPFFVHRMTNLSLANWHVLLLKERGEAALDVGCGFGSLALGLGEYFRRVVGVDPVPSRVAYASLRQSQDQRTGTSFLRGSGLALPFDDASFELSTMNGVLEWAGFHDSGEPRLLQLQLLREARRVLRAGGTAAIAIENRFAMETLMGMPDTHTGIRFIPALPRRIANILSHRLRDRPFRTYLYSARGYIRLLRQAGFNDVRVLDLVSSYNDYDFVVDVNDSATYRFLWSMRLVRTFYPRAGAVRHLAARAFPGLLGNTCYAFLLLAGDQVTTVLDDKHPIWTRDALRDRAQHLSRFAAIGSDVGTMLVVLHDGHRARLILELGMHEQLTSTSELGLPASVASQLAPRPTKLDEWSEKGVTRRLWSTGAD